MKASFHRRRQGRTADEAARGGSAARRIEKTQGRLHMELNDILEKLSLPQDLTRRGFLKAASAAAALGLLSQKWRAAVRDSRNGQGPHHRRPQSVRCLPPL
ncbi:twin-arginine translocation signal domain-containing protein [Sutterella wadsworthensis]|uniref:twin-arginine translocation signal domain-containing protein n=1 Tax=Sutterella wadsworthensis TaxID=40545 RepID=UPI003C6FEC69